jgi:aldose 1-epimerase
VTEISAGPLDLKQNQGEGTVPQSGAISLEQTEWPDAVNHQEWMNKKNLWGNLDIYTGYMAYKFKVDRKQEAAQDLIH